jgi:lipopolysaccharide export system permease protein
MRIIRGYFLRTICGASGLVLAVLMSLGGFIEFVGQLDDLGVGDYGVPQALVWVLLKLPNVVFQMMPIAVLLGALLGLGALAARSELIVLRAAGVSPAGFARAALATGVVLAVVALVLGESLGPPLERFARQFRAEAKFGNAAMGQGGGAWIRDGEVILNVTAPTEENPAGAVFLFRLDGEGGLAALGRADSVTVAEDNRWLLNNYAESAISADGVQVTHLARSPAVSQLNPDLLGLTVVREETLSGLALWRYIQYLRSNDLDARAYEVNFWSRIASSVAVAFMCMLAVPFVLGPLRSSGAGARMLAGLGIGLTWFLLSRTLADGGQVWNLSPALVAWLPTVVLGVISVMVVARTR